MVGLIHHHCQCQDSPQSCCQCPPGCGGGSPQGPPGNPHCLRASLALSGLQLLPKSPGPRLCPPASPWSLLHLCKGSMSHSGATSIPRGPGDNASPCIGSICAGMEVCRQDIPYIQPLHHAFSCALSDRSVPCPSTIIAASPPLGSSVLSSSSPSHTYLSKDEKQSH